MYVHIYSHTHIYICVNVPHHDKNFCFSEQNSSYITPKYCTHSSSIILFLCFFWLKAYSLQKCTFYDTESRTGAAEEWSYICPASSIKAGAHDILNLPKLSYECLILKSLNMGLIWCMGALEEPMGWLTTPQGKQVCRSCQQQVPWNGYPCLISWSRW